MDIYNYIKTDHRKVADLMEQVGEASDTATRERLFKQIKLELTIHADAEEQTFYKAILHNTRAKSVEHKMEHADHEHDEIRECLELLSTTPSDSDKWLILFGQLKHAVTHHVEEEEGEIFEKAKTYIDTSEAKTLARDMDALKSELKTSAPQDLTPA